MKISSTIRVGHRHQSTRPLGHPGRSLSLAVGLVTVLLAMPAGALAAGGISPRPAQTVRSRSQIVPVWAYLNGAVPVVGAQTRIVARGRAVRQSDGRFSARTNQQGVVLLAFAHVPRRFTVIASGGRAGGRQVKGSQRSSVAGYRAAGVVVVNPLTTVLARLRHERPQLTPGRSALIVKRYFRIPAWADMTEDLRTSHGWFDAGAYLRQAQRSGSTNRLTRLVVWRMLHGFRRTPYIAVPVRGRTAEVTARTAGLGAVAAQRVSKVFKNLLGTAVEIHKQELVGGALGGLLQLVKAVGLDLSTKSELDGVREQLDAIGTQLTELKGQVAEVSKALERINASQLLHQSDDIIGKIDTAQTDLTVLANSSPPDPTRKDYAEEIAKQKNYAEDIIKFIGSNLRDAPARLDLQLSPRLAIGDDVFKAASRSLATGNQFFDQRDSQEVQAVYDYFATSQAQLAILLANYYNASHYSVKASQELISRLHSNVTKQTKSLKPEVPAGTFIDTRTPSFMWAMSPQTVTALNLVERDMQTSTTISVAGFHNYQMPSFPDFRNLLKDSTGDPRAWLQARVEVPISSPIVWASDSVVKRLGINGEGLYVRIFDLATGKEEQYNYGHSFWFTGTPCGASLKSCVATRPDLQDFLRPKTGGLLLLRYLAPGESYYW